MALEEAADAAEVSAAATKTLVVRTKAGDEFRVTVPAAAWFEFGADDVLHIKGTRDGQLAAFGGVYRWAVEHQVQVERQTVRPTAVR